MAKANKGSKKKVLIFGILGILLIAVILLVVLGGSNEQIVTVQSEKVDSRDITQTVAATGTIYPEFQVILRPEVNGEIVELPFEEGAHVKKGDLLIRIKDDIYKSQRNRAKANLQAAKATLKVRKATLDQVEAEYNRIKGLYEKDLASASQLEIAKSNFLQQEGLWEAQQSNVSQAEESLREAEENLAKTTIYAPFDGIITDLNVELSERVLGSSFSQGTQLMTVADLNNIEARVEVDENDIVLISQSDTANIEIDAFGDRQFKGIVSQIGNSAQATGLGSQDQVVNFEVRIKLLETDDNIRPGMSCDADIRTETKKGVLSVPIQSVTARMDEKKIGKKGENSDEESERGRNGNSNGNGKKVQNKPDEVVFIVNGDRAKMVKVETGISDDSYIEIKSGLNGDEMVVTGPYRAISKELKDSVKVINESGDKKFGARKDKSEN